MCDQSILDKKFKNCIFNKVCLCVTFEYVNWYKLKLVYLNDLDTHQIFMLKYTNR